MLSCRKLASYVAIVLWVFQGDLLMELSALLKVQLDMVSARVNALINCIQLLAERPRRERNCNARFGIEFVCIYPSFPEPAETLQLLITDLVAIANVSSQF